MNNVIEGKKIGNRYIIVLPKELRNRVWSNSYGRIQKDLRENVGECTEILINALYIEWVDPIPMLSLLLSIAENRYMKKVFFVVPEIEKMMEEQKRAFEFLEKGGFLSEMQRLGASMVMDSDLAIGRNIDFKDRTNEILNQIKQIEGFVYYTDSTLLKAKVIDLSDSNYNSESKVENEIEKELKQIEYQVKQFHKGSQLNELMWKTGHFLNETINNIREHAYDYEDEKASKQEVHKYASYYIRQRVGLSDNTLTKENRDNIEKSLNKEYSDLPKFDLEFSRSSTNFLEVFVLDAGIGLTESLRNAIVNTNLVERLLKNEELDPDFRDKLFEYREHPEKFTFREAWRVTIGLGERGSNGKKLTQFGGLYALARLLEREFFMCRDERFWIGDIMPVEGNNKSYLMACENKDPNYYVQGLALMCRLSIQKPMDQNWISTDKNKPSDYDVDTTKIANCFIGAAKEEKSIYEKYYHSTFSKLQNKPYIVDERFELSFMKEGEMNYLEHKEESEEKGNAKISYCMFLPSNHELKNKIYKKIVDIQSVLGDRNGSKTIIIADIPVCECGVYQLALENASFKEDFTNQLERIVMISKRLSVRVLCRRGKTFVFSPTETKNYIEENHHKVFSPHKSLFHAIEWLKSHDSMIVWRYIVRNNETGCFFVPQEVKWYKDELKDNTLDGYLDFEQTLTDAFLKKIYHNALIRTLCLSCSSECRCFYQGEDPMMSGLAKYMNTWAYNDSSDQNDSTKVSLGSVFVSGTSQNTEAKYNVNMFLHKDSKEFVVENSIMHLFAWPEKNLFSKPLQLNNYCRVGSTYAIAPFGWRYFPIPRYKASSTSENIANKLYFDEGEIERKNIEFKSIYVCPPPDTYKYWQGRNGGPFLGISHVDYETKHDILFIDFPFKVEESFLMGGDLASFLLGEIAAAFSLDEKDLDFHDGFDHGFRFKNSVLKHKRIVSDKYKERQCSFLVYPYHPNTEIIIDKIKEYIKKDIIIIPLVPINKERNGTSFQPSPLTIEMLRKLVDSYGEKEVNALFFDDAIVDGKTQEEIKHIMYWLGVKHVMSVFILERRRMPYSTSDNSKTSVFWRLDIPRLGTKYSCPLCEALHSIRDFQNRIIYESAKKRVSEWIILWKSRTESTIEHIHTLSPQKIQLEQPRKRFGIYFEGNECKQCGGDENRIELHSSLGLTLYMGELLSVTSRDDKMLQYCTEKYNLDGLTILEMLCTNLLLYGKTINRKVREKIILQIFKNANRFDEPNNHTAFAALVLMTQDDEALKCLINTCEKMHRSNRFPNYDMQILLSYLGDIEPKYDVFNYAKQMRQNSMTPEELYKRFHKEVYNDSGEIHSTPLARIKKGTINKPNELLRGVNSLDDLKYVLSQIFPSDFVVSDKNTKVEIDTELVCDGNIIDYAKKMIEENKNRLNSITIEQFEQNRYEYSNQIQKLFNILSVIHKGLFLPINVKSENTDGFQMEFELLNKVRSWQKRLREKGNGYTIGTTTNFKPIVLDDSNISEKWMIWDQTVEDEMWFLIDNATKYSNGKLVFPDFGVGEYNVWITIKYEEDLTSLSLLLYNKTTPEHNAAYITRETAKNTRYSRRRFLNDLHIKVDYNDFGREVIETKIQIPLI
jgi:hypothetical protein